MLHLVAALAVASVCAAPSYRPAPSRPGPARPAPSYRPAPPSRPAYRRPQPNYRPAPAPAPRQPRPNYRQPPRHEQPRQAPPGPQHQPQPAPRRSFGRWWHAPAAGMLGYWLGSHHQAAPEPIDPDPQLVAPPPQAQVSPAQDPGMVRPAYSAPYVPQWADSPLDPRAWCNTLPVLSCPPANVRI